MRSIRAGAVGLIATVLLVACARTPRRIDDPLTVMLSDRQSDVVREQAVLEARTQAGDDPVAVRAVAAGWEEAVLSDRTSERVRRAALRALLHEPDPEVQERAQKLVNRLLPDEPSPVLAGMMCEAAGDRGWQSCVPALVRRAARHGAPGQDEARRPERLALGKLRPGVSLEETMFSVVIDPPHQEPRFGVDPVPRTQQDAWHALCRLDPAGERRIAMVRAAAPSNPRGVAVIESLRAALSDLRGMPDSGEELAWLLSLRDMKDERIATWWRDVTSAVVLAPSEETFELRHAEALRWAKFNRPAWLGMSRGALLEELRARLAGRSIRERAQPASGRLYRETLAGQEDALRWGDLLQLLVIDDALQDRDIVRSLLQQARLDSEDTRAQYGGVIMARRDDPARYAPVLYLPRAAQRLGDERFKPGEDMIRQGSQCLAQFHFHAQRGANTSDAGPTPEDLAQVQEYRRAMLVVTALGRGTMNIDAVLPVRRDVNVVIDLGVFRADSESAR